MMEEKVSQCCYQNLIQITANVLKNGFSKKIALEYDFSYNIGKDDISFSQKYDLVVSKKKWKYDIFCIFGKDGISFYYKYDIVLLSKKQR